MRTIAEINEALKTYDFKYTRWNEEEIAANKLQKDDIRRGVAAAVNDLLGTDEVYVNSNGDGRKNELVITKSRGYLSLNYAYVTFKVKKGKSEYSHRRNLQYYTLTEVKVVPSFEIIANVDANNLTIKEIVDALDADKAESDRKVAEANLGECDKLKKEISEVCDFESFEKALAVIATSNTAYSLDDPRKMFSEEVQTKLKSNYTLYKFFNNIYR